MAKKRSSKAAKTKSKTREEETPQPSSSSSSNSDGKGAIFAKPTGKPESKTITNTPDNQDSEVETVAAPVVKRMTWDYRKELLLIQQILVDKPFTAKHGQTKKSWDAVVEHLLQTHATLFAHLKHKNAKEKFEALYSTWRKQDIVNQNSTGKEEDMNEKDIGLSKIHQELTDHERSVASTKKVKEEQQVKKEILGRLRPLGHGTAWMTKIA